MPQAIFDAQRNFYLKNPPPNLSERIQRLSTLERAILIEKTEISKALNLDLGKSEFESFVSEIDYVLSEIKYIKKHLATWMKDQRVPSSWLQYPARSYIIREPRGQVLVMAPWNYPFQLALAPVIAALAAGNTVILKPSELAPHTASVLEKIINSNFEPQIFKVINGDANLAQILLGFHFDFCFFTGSTQVGRKVMELAARNLIPVCLELGGKSPALVDSSANIDLSARRIVWGKFFNAGQTCVAPDFVWAHGKIYEELLQKLAFYIKEFFGPNAEKSSDFGRIINEKHFLRLQSLHLENHCLIGGEWNLKQRYIPPSIYRDIEWQDSLMQDEIFGPLLPVMKFQDWSEVEETLLRKPKPLSLYLFSQDSELNKRIIRRLPFGGGCINDCVIHLANPRLPFGGVGASGMGAYHGRFGFELMTHQKPLVIQKGGFDFAAKYPPYTWAKKFLKMKD